MSMGQDVLKEIENHLPGWEAAQPLPVWNTSQWMMIHNFIPMFHTFVPWHFLDPYYVPQGQHQKGLKVP
jgi:hypothetical protein